VREITFHHTALETAESGGKVRAVKEAVRRWTAADAPELNASVTVATRRDSRFAAACPSPALRLRRPAALVRPLFF
jgi:hypothetical protein